MNIKSLATLLSVDKLTKNYLCSQLRFSQESAELLLTGKCPLGEDLEKLLSATNLPENEFRLRTACLSIEAQYSFLACKETNNKICVHETLNPEFCTDYGRLYQCDCIEILRQIPDNTFDMIFADPPFNLNKIYSSNIDDRIPENEYINWSEQWLIECCRTLKFGGSIFVWNIPKWSIVYADILNNYLNFKHWIAVEIKSGMPIAGRLYPSHYSLLYFTKSKSKTFTPDRIPAQTCKYCFKELHDYGGHKDKMNPNGVNLSDIWTDISPVRHNKYKNREYPFRG